MKKVRVTPEMARQWLDDQVRNRNISENTVNHYVSMMRDGDWLCEDSVPLRFNEDGRLVDGQHRLTAVERHGKPVDFFVAKTTLEVLDALHDTKARTLADRLVMMGTSGDAKAIAALGSILCDRMENGHVRANGTRSGFGSKQRRPVEIVAAFAWARVDPVEITVQAKSFYSQQLSNNRMISQTLIGYLLSQGAPRCEEFVSEMVLDEHPSRRESVRSLRRQLGNSKYTNTVKLALCSTAFNNHSLKTVKLAERVPDLNGGTFVGR